MELWWRLWQDTQLIPTVDEVVLYSILHSSHYSVEEEMIVLDIHQWKIVGANMKISSWKERSRERDLRVSKKLLCTINLTEDFVAVLI